MRIALILIVQLFPFFIFSQNENNEIIQNSEMASYFNSYDIIKVIKDEFNLEELNQKDWDKENDEYYNFKKDWVKKEIGYLSEFIKTYGISNWNHMKLKFIELEKNIDVKSSYYENLPHGYWDFGNYKGEFKNGKQNGEWILKKEESNSHFEFGEYVGELLDTVINHEFYDNGLAVGQWFTMKNGIRFNTLNFVDGKLDGQINLHVNNYAVNIFGDYVNRGIEEINMIFLNGIPHGSFTWSNQYRICTGSYNLGIPNRKWDIYKIDWKNANKILCNEYKMEINEKYFTIKESNFKSNSSDNFEKEYYISDKNGVFKQTNWFKYKIIVNDYKETRFTMSEKIENQKITSIRYRGSDEFRNGKKEQEFYSNGKLKQEGVVNQYRKEYDINGKLIRSSSQFNSLWDGVH
jgi:hypothetical protein